MFVVPEIERRLVAGTLAEKDLPFQVLQFRWIQGGGKNIIELNDEVKLLIKARTTRSVEPGQPLTMDDIDPNECYLEGPVVDGKAAGFYLSSSMFLNFMNVFRFHAQRSRGEFSARTAQGDPVPCRGDRTGGNGAASHAADRKVQATLRR
jgi:hypothetical protein